MIALAKPSRRPANPNFSSGPCAKRPGWSAATLDTALLGRSHRSDDGRAHLQQALQRTRALLALPEDYLIGIVPGSDTGAFEMALWSMLGARGVDVLAWDSFGRLWVTDIVAHLRLADVRTLDAEAGRLPELARVDFDRDVVFTWNGTTSGVRVPDGAWIASDRQGLTFVDATSAVFAQPIDWRKTDVVTFSWQKALGGEAAHGMLILSPRAVARLESYTPPWPLPKLFRLTRDGRLNRAIFDGETINTPSLLCLADWFDALSWAERIGGRQSLMDRADRNAAVLHDWLERSSWAANLGAVPATWSNTSVCLKFSEPDLCALPMEQQHQIGKAVCRLLDQDLVARDIAAYRGMPPGLRIWTGPTIETDDLLALTPWLDWAFSEAETMRSA